MKKKCAKYHNWMVFGVGGCLPNQEVDLVCKRCGVIVCVDISDSLMEVC